MLSKSSSQAKNKSSIFNMNLKTVSPLKNNYLTTGRNYRRLRGVDLKLKRPLKFSLSPP